MKTILKVILFMSLVLAGGHTVTNTPAVENDRVEDFQPRYCQDNKIREAVHEPISRYGEHAPVLTIELFSVTKAPSGDPTFSPLLFKSVYNKLKSVAVSIALHPYRQYDVDAPFYCLPPSEYYIFALRRIII